MCIKYSSIHWLLLDSAENLFRLALQHFSFFSILFKYLYQRQFHSNILFPNSITHTPERQQRRVCIDSDVEYWLLAATRGYRRYSLRHGKERRAPLRNKRGTATRVRARKKVERRQNITASGTKSAHPPAAASFRKSLLCWVSFYIQKEQIIPLVVVWIRLVDGGKLTNNLDKTVNRYNC